VQGTVWGYADEQGDVVARWTYDAWGNALTEEVDASAAELRAVRYRFQGRERSAATGLANFRMRWYDAETGRWLSKDPIGLSGGLNLYAFCGGDPVNHNDPQGLLSPWVVVPIVGGVVGGLIGGYVDGVEGCVKGTISGAVGGALGLGAGGGIWGSVVAGATSEGLNGLMNGNPSLANVGIAGLIGGGFSKLGGVGLAAGLWTNVWTMINNWACEKLGK